MLVLLELEPAEPLLVPLLEPALNRLRAVLSDAVPEAEVRLEPPAPAVPTEVPLEEAPEPEPAEEALDALAEELDDPLLPPDEPPLLPPLDDPPPPPPPPRLPPPPPPPPPWRGPPRLPRICGASIEANRSGLTVPLSRSVF